MGKKYVSEQNRGNKSTTYAYITRKPYSRCSRWLDEGRKGIETRMGKDGKGAAK